MVQRISVTGATGFIGRCLVRLLARPGREVRALVRKPERLDLREWAGIEVIAGDLAQETALERLCEGAGAVIHCAGAVLHEAHFAASNIDGAERLAKAARRQGVSRLVHVSSLAAREPELSAYAGSKRRGEEALLASAGEAASVIVRPPAVYGPGDRATLPLIAQLTRRHAFVPGTPDQRFSLIYVDDLARALVHLAAVPESHEGVVELDDGRTEGYSWRELGAIAAETHGRPVKVFHMPRPVMAGAARVLSLAGSGRIPALGPGKLNELYHHDWVCRDRRLELLSGWRPEVGFGHGLSLTLAWYRREGWLPPARGAVRTAPHAEKGERAG